MKNEDLKVGQWWGNGNALPIKILDVYAPRSTYWYRHHDRTSEYLGKLPSSADPPLRLLSPAELSAAGIADSDRLCEQRSVNDWDGVTFKYDRDVGPRPYSQFECFVDGRYAFDVLMSDVLNNNHHEAYTVDVTDKCGEFRSREDVLAAVLAFRKKRDEGKLRAPPSASVRNSLDSSCVLDLADGRRVGVSADMHCGKPVLSVTELDPPSRIDAEADYITINRPTDDFGNRMPVDPETAKAVAALLKLAYEHASQTLAPRVGGSEKK